VARTIVRPTSGKRRGGRRYTNSSEARHKTPGVVDVRRTLGRFAGNSRRYLATTLQLANDRQGPSPRKGADSAVRMFACSARSRTVQAAPRSSGCALMSVAVPRDSHHGVLRFGDALDVIFVICPGRCCSALEQPVRKDRVRTSFENISDDRQGKNAGRPGRHGERPDRGRDA